MRYTLRAVLIGASITACAMSSILAAAPPAPQAPAASPADLRITTDVNWKSQHYNNKPATSLDVSIILQGGDAARASASGDVKIESFKNENGQTLKPSYLSGMLLVKGEYRPTKHPKNGVRMTLDLCDPPPLKKIAELRGSLGLQVGGDFRPVVIPDLLKQTGEVIDDATLKRLGVTIRMTRLKPQTGANSPKSITPGVPRGSQEGFEFKVTADKSAVISLDLTDSKGKRLKPSGWNLSYGKTVKEAKLSFDEKLPDDCQLHLTIHENTKEIRVPFAFNNIEVPEKPEPSRPASAVPGLSPPGQLMPVDPPAAKPQIDMGTAAASAGLLAFGAEMVAPLLLCSSIPVGCPPIQDPALARIAPEQCEVYLAWAGIGDPDPKSTNRAEQFLADPEIRHMRSEAARRFRLLFKSLPSSLDSGPFALIPLGEMFPPSIAADAVTWSELAATQPCAFFLCRSATGTKSARFQGAMVMNIGDSQKQVAAMLSRYQKMAAGAIEKVPADGGFECHVKADTEWNLRWALRDRHFIIAWGGQSPSAIAKRMNGAEPKWFTAIASNLPVQRRAAVLRIDCQGLLQSLDDAQARTQAKEIGLDRLRTLTLVTGLDSAEFVSRVLVEVDEKTAAQWKQAMARPVSLDDLTVVPRDATLALAANIEPGRLMACMAWLQEKMADADVGSTNNGSNSNLLNAASMAASGDLASIGDVMRQHFVLAPGAFNEQLCRELKESLGETWRLYASPSEGSLVFLNITGVVRVKAPQRLARTFEGLVARKKPVAKPDKKDLNDWAVRKTRFADHDIYCLQGSSGSGSLLAWCLVDDELVCSPSPQNVKAFLLCKGSRTSLAQEPVVMETLGTKPLPALVGYEDSREMFRLMYPLAQCGVNLATAVAGLHPGSPDPMLLPAAPTVAKYLRPAVSTVSMVPQGVEITLHQSLPNGNLGMMLYLALCSSLPETLQAWTGSANTEGQPKQQNEHRPPVVVYKTFTEKEGRCAIKERRFNDDEDTVEIGRNFQGVCKFYSDDFFRSTIINAGLHVKNASKGRRACQYYVAFFDKNGKLVGCGDGRTMDTGLTPGEDTSLSCLLFLPEEQIKEVVSYRVRLYESETLPEPKK